MLLSLLIIALYSPQINAHLFKCLFRLLNVKYLNPVSGCTIVGWTDCESIDFTHTVRTFKLRICQCANIISMIDFLLYRIIFDMQLNSMKQDFERHQIFCLHIGLYSAC